LLLLTTYLSCEIDKQNEINKRYSFLQKRSTLNFTVKLKGLGVKIRHGSSSSKAMEILKVRF